MSDAEKNENEGKFTFKISEGKETNEKGDTEEVKDGDKCETAEDLNKSHDPYFPPIITLPEVHVESGEKEEEELFKIRAKLYRYAHECDPPEWKERGTGDVKLLKHAENGTVRLLMRRDKTLKVLHIATPDGNSAEMTFQSICANHFILPWMELKPNCGSEKAWIWKVQADYADNESKSETLAIKFSNKENAQKFESAFEKAREWVLESEAKQILEEQNGRDESSEGKQKTKEMNNEKTDKGKDDTNIATKLKEMVVKD